jgi:hypothetical protein
MRASPETAVVAAALLSSSFNSFKRATSIWARALISTSMFFCSKYHHHRHNRRKQKGREKKIGRIDERAKV